MKDVSETWVINSNGLAAVVSWAMKLSTPVSIEPLPYDNYRVVWVHGLELGTKLPYEILREFEPNKYPEEPEEVRPQQFEHSHTCYTHGDWTHNDPHCDVSEYWMECPRPASDHPQIGEA